MDRLVGVIAFLGTGVSLGGISLATLGVTLQLPLLGRSNAGSGD